MTLNTLGSLRWANAFLVVGTLVVFGSAAVGLLNAFAVPADMMDMPDMPGHAMTPMASHQLHGMPLSKMPEMYVAVAGLVLAGLGTKRRSLVKSRSRAEIPLQKRGNIVVALIGTAALTIDVSKTSTLGFVLPGMSAEYGLHANTASLLAVAGLTGAAAGALVFGFLVERIGPRSSYLLATLGFTATSMCGSMPTFQANVAMCGVMGITVGGLAPLVVTMLADAVGDAARGPVVTGLSVVATAAGYLVAAGSALWLEPVFGWRILWLIGAPTGVVLAALTPWVPDRANRRSRPAPAPSPEPAAKALTVGVQRVFALLIGVATFGLTTWVPTLARTGGVGVGTANLLLTVSALVMVPCALLLMVSYRRFGPVSTASAIAGGTAVLLLVLTATGATSAAAWVCAAALAGALFAVNTLSAIFLPIAADLADPRGRGRTTGSVSLFNRLGGLCGPLLLASLVSSASQVLVAVAVLAVLCALSSWYLGRRQRSLPDLPAPEPAEVVASVPAPSSNG